MIPDRARVAAWLEAGLEAVDPEVLTTAAMEGLRGPLRVIAIGKAAPAMCRGAVAAVGSISGICVSNHDEVVPDGIDLIVGDHPVPGSNSLMAGQRVSSFAPRADIALISGGGSALCEVPAEGLTLEHVAEVTRSLLDNGVEIGAANNVRVHLSSIKGGGLGPIPTFVLSDVCGHGPGVVSSGPTIPMEADPLGALDTLHGLDLQMPAEVEAAIRRPRSIQESPPVSVIGDGRTAAEAVARAAKGVVDEVRVLDSWVTGPLEDEVARFIDESTPGVTIASGEPSLRVSGAGTGGRNTHAALLAAAALAGSSSVFAALATDGIDGSSDGAGAIVDGGTVVRGGDAAIALQEFDSASYLTRSGDLIETGPTGTNVADLWLIWNPGD